MAPETLFALWLFSAVTWGNHGGDVTSGWYNSWAGYEAGACAEAGVAAVRGGWAEAFLCQPASFSRPEPMTQPVERK